MLIGISREVREIFKLFFIHKLFGVVTAAIQGNVDCVDYISHLVPFKLTADGEPAARARFLPRQPAELTESLDDSW
jgi:hypothetical protein